MKRFIAAICLPVVLGGCATFDHMRTGLKGLMGTKPNVAINVLGYPDKKMNVNDRTVYIWSQRSQGSLLLKGADGSLESMAVNHNCIIKIGYNWGRAEKWQFRGDRGGCSYFSEQLARYANSGN